MKQLGLPISLDSKLLLSNFFGDKNQSLLSFIETLFTGKDSSIVFISGANSSGKTHVLQGCAFKALDQGLTAMYVDVKQELPNRFLNTLSDYDWVFVDNIDQLDVTQQQELFDLYNQIKGTSTKLIVSALVLPGELELLKDLKTRLSLAVIFSLEQLTDIEKIELIKLKMKDKNLDIDEKVYAYLFKYFSRDLTMVLSALDRLDQESLRQKSVISIPFSKKILDI
ncbi:MAG TPA: DnaA regulatory inactivator Hda [Candidatus Thioglobus sp.]|jgi:DnaA family protein|nr:DnaA regulatory inactivator Hda [Candidatus Thioglobus sp.]HIB30577.1 DnaA regulatory inactivator Hda [Candidatus Thioglobus sp.]HIB98021.1 DnaA regulatory inactivator Hda [Candidatus Thioglobus sp.]